MFSEYASRFLAQSQSRISNFVQPAHNGEASSGSPFDKYGRTGQPSRNPSRVYPSRQGNPYYNHSHISNFNFASRYSNAPDAPLFHSALDEFGEDDEAERERESADFFALQKSRRVFASARLEDSSEAELEASIESAHTTRNHDRGAFEDRGQGLGIKSSWIGTGPKSRGIHRSSINYKEEDEFRQQRMEESETLMDGSVKDKMVDIGLGSSHDSDDLPDILHAEASTSGSPPAFQNFRSTKSYNNIELPSTSNRMNSPAGITQPTSFADSMPLNPSIISDEAPMHDMFWGSLYLICFGGMFATFFLVFLHTELPKKTLGDTIYTTLNSSLYLFAVYTVISIFVALIWLALLRSFVRPLIYLILIAVPIVLSSFSLHPFIASFNRTSDQQGASNQAMRWLSLIPGVLSFVWVYTIYKGRFSLAKAVGIIEFASKILAANQGLLVMGFAVLVTIVLWTWLWLGMFTRVFLGGHLSSSLTKFIIDTSSWWLGVYFILMYIWTLSVISGIQRSTIAATVSEWYFHRNVKPSPSSNEVVIAALTHATTTVFGTISLTSLVNLAIRLPLILLPRRITGILSIFTYSWITTPVTALSNPLTLTYAAIHSKPLRSSAQGLSQMSFLTPQKYITAATPRSFNARNYQHNILLPYRLAKLLLYATRFIMAVALGFSGWIAAAKKLKISLPEGSGIRGSAYAYAVGLVAGFIGWGVLGAVEGILCGIVDASVVCWGSEKETGGGGGSYCIEACYLFGEARMRD